MKRPYLSFLFTLLPTFAALLMFSHPFPRADAALDPFRCTDSSIYFPTSGLVGWTYQDPASTDTDSEGNPTVHTGVDIFAEGGDGSPVYAPADGVVLRHPGPESLNLVLPAVTNVLTGEAGLELYFSHLRHTLVLGQAFNAGDIIGVQEGDHVHFSVGAFIGYDDREIDQTQDPSPYFSAALRYNSSVQDRQSTAHWCYIGDSTEDTDQLIVEQEHVVRADDTLSGIAEMYSVTVDALAAANGLDEPDYLYVGQELIIPEGGDGSIQAPDASSSGQTNIARAPQRYLVEEGDSLYAIAHRFGTDVEAIVQLNTLADPDVIGVGDYLLIP